MSIATASFNFGMSLGNKLLPMQPKVNHMDIPYFPLFSIKYHSVEIRVHELYEQKMYARAIDLAVDTLAEIGGISFEEAKKITIDEFYTYLQTIVPDDFYASHDLITRMMFQYIHESWEIIAWGK